MTDYEEKVKEYYDKMVPNKPKLPETPEEIAQAFAGFTPRPNPCRKHFASDCVVFLFGLGVAFLFWTWDWTLLMWLMLIISVIWIIHSIKMWWSVL